MGILNSKVSYVYVLTLNYTEELKSLYNFKPHQDIVIVGIYNNLDIARDKALECYVSSLLYEVKINKVLLNSLYKESIEDNDNTVDLFANSTIKEEAMYRRTRAERRG